MTDSRQENPLDQGPKPPFPAQEQAPPGLESEMDPRPDYGAETYRGTGKLREKAAVVTGGDSDRPRRRPRRLAGGRQRPWTVSE